MGNYIWSNANRFYAALEQHYGMPPSVSAINRFPAVRLKAHQRRWYGNRRDKTGTRTHLGSSSSSKRISEFEVATYLTSWSGTGQPAYGPLISGAMGGSVQLPGRITISSGTGNAVQTLTAHGLSVGAAVAFAGEIRFAVSVQAANAFMLNAPFSQPLTSGSVFTQTACYGFATQIPSLALFDYWDPVTAVSRIVTGGGVDSLLVKINGDFHELIFRGPAADVLDSISSDYGVSGLTQFPNEPAQTPFDYSIVPGHLGQVWLGSPSSEFFTVTDASIEIKNHLLVRDQEFGSSFPKALVPGMREILVQLTLFAQDGPETEALYTAAKTRTPIPMMLQMGRQTGQMMAVFLPSVVPEMPIYDDMEPNLLWQFKNCVAQGVSNDEAYIAFA